MFPVNQTFLIVLSLGLIALLAWIVAEVKYHNESRAERKMLDYMEAFRERDCTWG